jgi:EF-P beta-lysylation protein EpmB
MKSAYNDPEELLGQLNLERDHPGLSSADFKSSFPLRVPQGFVGQIKKGDPLDPLLLQILPTMHEQQSTDGYLQDPVGDLQASRTPGLLHKYQGRALIIATGACAIHCRYCFRRHYPYAEGMATTAQWASTIDYLRSDPDIREVILSGGDPLMAGDEKLTEWFRSLSDLPQLKRIRIHSRMPVVLPERVTSGLLHLLQDAPLPVVFVVHANHPQEIHQQVRESLQAIRQTGCTLLNQSVLLKGVNDKVDTLAELSERLFDSATLPYYLHLLDRVQGAAHFEVEEAEAIRLHRDLAARLPGYLVPRLVREIPGEAAKTQVPNGIA